VRFACSHHLVIEIGIAGMSIVTVLGARSRGTTAKHFQKRCTNATGDGINFLSARSAGSAPIMNNTFGITTFNASKAVVRYVW
jgi:hypothetical protein